MSIEEQIALLNQRIQKLSSNGKNVENVGVLRSLVRERRNLLRKLSWQIKVKMLYKDIYYIIRY